MPVPAWSIASIDRPSSETMLDWAAAELGAGAESAEMPALMLWRAALLQLRLHRPPRRQVAVADVGKLRQSAQVHSLGGQSAQRSLAIALVADARNLRRLILDGPQLLLRLRAGRPNVGQ